MQKHRLVFYLMLLFISLIVSNRSFGQSEQDLAELYENQQFLSLRKYLDNNQINDADWRMFITALFEPNADSALYMFDNVYKTSLDKTLQRYVVERVSEYYYARGYYKTAERLLKDRKSFNGIVSEKSDSEIDKVNYGIQVGAFSNYDNAAKMKNKVLKKVKNVTIVNKESNGERLYVVVIGKYSNREVAEKEFQVLKRKNNINGFVIQY